MAVPIALRYLLPVGVKGMFLTLMVLGLISGDASHMLTWGGIFIQDIVLPLRTAPMSPRQHVTVLRFALAGVALFAFLFSIFFHQTQYIVMWWAITEGIFACGAGIVIIGGLYWKKEQPSLHGPPSLSGSVLSLSGIIGPYFGLRHLPALQRKAGAVRLPPSLRCWYTSSFRCCTTKNDFDLDRMLHRG